MLTLLVFFLSTSIGTAHAAGEATSAPSASGAGYVSETNRELIRAYTRFALGSRDYLGAEAALKDHLATDPQDAEASNLLGMTYLQTGQNTEAARQFLAAVKAVPREDPLRGYFLYNLADAYVRAGYVAEATKTLALLSTHPRLWLAASDVSRDLHPKKPLPLPRLVPLPRFSATAVVVSGYDTNVVLASDSAVTAEEVSGQASPVLTPVVDLRGGWPVGYGDENWSVGARALYQFNSSETASAFNLMAVHADVEKSDAEPAEAGGFANAWGGDLDTAFLNKSGFGFYNAVVKGGWSAIWRVAEKGRLEFRVPLRYQLFTAAASSNDDRSGPGASVGIAWRQRFEGAIATIGANADYLLASGKNYVALTAGIPFALQIKDVFWKTGLNFSLEAQNIDFLNSTSDRLDQRYSAGLGLHRAWGRRLTSSLDYVFQRNLSTLDSADYSKHVLTLSIAMEVL